jgi:hypothetical protein
MWSHRTYISVMALIAKSARTKCRQFGRCDAMLATTFSA